MADEELRAIQELSRKNLEDIGRRAKENDPLEVRVLQVCHGGSVTNFTLRVWGFIDGRPVSSADDWQAWSDFTDGLYKCHWCLDHKRVYLHGEQREPDVRRRGPGSPCPKCVPHLTAANYWHECGRFPTVSDTGVDVQGLLRGAVAAYLNRLIAPQIRKAVYAKLLGPVGELVALDKQALKVTFVAFDNVPDGSDGRLVLVDDQGHTFKQNKKNLRGPGEAE